MSRQTTCHQSLARRKIFGCSHALATTLLLILVLLSTRVSDALLLRRDARITSSPTTAAERNTLQFTRLSPIRQSSSRSKCFHLQATPNDNDDNNVIAAVDYTDLKPQVVPQRWIQLGYLSLLALLSDWVCFSVAAAPSTFESCFDHSAASIIDIFLFTNVATSFLVTDVVARFGLQRAIQGAALFMTAGCWLRSGIGFLPNGDDSFLVSYPFIVAGTILVGTCEL